MNKILLIVGICLMIISASLILNGISSPEMTYTIETIKPQIICYGGGC
jgi:hypothetical protein